MLRFYAKCVFRCIICTMRWLAPLIRFAFHHFYNTFAFTYDAVSALV